MINFPSSPTLDQEYSFGDRVWKYNGTGWALKIDAVALTSGDIADALGYAPVNPTALATVATTGSYNDLLDKPTATGQVNSDWDATSGVEEILNKPTLGTAAATDVEDYATAAQGALADTAVQPASTNTLTNKVIDSITNQVGADHIHLKVQASEAITKGNVVKVTGYNSGENALRVGKVSSAADVAVGVAHDDISNGDFGAIINTGVLDGINTSAFTVGTILYPNTSGGLTSTAPTSGAYQALAYVIRSQSNNGAILIEASEPNFTRATANTANTLVQRDSSGNFSAGTITAALSGNASTATALQTARNINGVSFDGTANITVADATKLPLAGGTVTGAISGKTYFSTALTNVTTLTINTADTFSKTVTAATTFAVSGTPASGLCASFILDLTNGGAFTLTWWNNIKWANGVVPTLTASGRDVLGFFTYDGGTTWTGFLLGKDVK
jgi:hypothetical protein